ncbi:MAG: hypothetical protein AB1564_17135 [Chloroflexota bacterium]
MENALGLVLFILFSGAGLISLLAAVNLLFPVPVQRTREALEASFGRAFLLGLVNGLFILALAALFLRLGEDSGRVVGAFFVLLLLVLVLGLVIFLVIGLSAFTRLVGERMGAGKNAFASHLRGGALTVLAGLTPYLGWFVFTPVVLFAGLGAAIQALIRRKPAPVG